MVAAVPVWKWVSRKLTAALEDFDRAIELNPNLAVACNNRGGVKDNLGLPEDAIADFNRAIDLKPDYAKAYYNRGDTERNLGNISGARGDYQRTLDLAQETGEADLVAGVQRNLSRLDNDNTEEP